MRVRAGPYKDRDAAQAAHAKLKSAGIDAALIAPN
jgi:cell division protein FtsN